MVRPQFYRRVIGRKLVMRASASGDDDKRMFEFVPAVEKFGVFTQRFNDFVEQFVEWDDFTLAEIDQTFIETRRGPVTRELYVGFVLAELG